MNEPSRAPGGFGSTTPRGSLPAPVVTAIHCCADIRPNPDCGRVTDRALVRDAAGPDSGDALSPRKEMEFCVR